MTDRIDKRSDSLIKHILKNYNNKKIVLWGKCKISDSIRKQLWEQFGIEISFYVDNSIAKQNGSDVFPPTILKENHNKYYIVVPFANQETIVNTLELYGYKKNSDYFYYGDISATIIMQTEDYYEDSFGNKIYGDYKNINIKFIGVNSTVILGNNFKSDKTFKLQIRDNSAVEYGDNCTADCEMIIYDESQVKIGDNCNISTGLIFVLNGELIIGKNFTIGKGFDIRILPHTSMQVGEDCMFSYDIKVRTNDGHAIFDVETGNNINDTKEISSTRNIIIENHVWLSMGVCVLYNTRVGGGTVIGANSLIKGKIPNNCIAAGIPARVIRKNIAWSRKKETENIEDCGLDNINYTIDN